MKKINTRLSITLVNKEFYLISLFFPSGLFCFWSSRSKFSSSTNNCLLVCFYTLVACFLFCFSSTLRPENNGQVLRSANLSAETKTQCASTYHSRTSHAHVDIHITYGQGLENGQSKEESPELGFELRMGIFCRLSGSEFQPDGAMKLNECSPKDVELRFGMLKTFSLILSYLVS